MAPSHSKMTRRNVPKLLAGVLLSILCCSVSGCASKQPAPDNEPSTSSYQPPPSTSEPSYDSSVAQTVNNAPLGECRPECEWMEDGACAVEISTMDSTGIVENDRLICKPNCCSAAANDRDRDGIPDDTDQCPDEPEDFDNFQDDDGCPDRDNDGDGIPDDVDECPLDPETVNGFQDDDGCPDDDAQKTPDKVIYETVIEKTKK